MMAKSKSDSISSRIGVIDGLVQGNMSSDDLHTSLLARDGLLDSLLLLYEECTHEHLMRNKHVATFVKKYDTTIKQLQKLRIQPKDFDVKDVIGRGHFGEVQVVRDKKSGTVYAMKTLHKHETLAQQEISFFEEERDIMAKAKSPWITQLHFAFQDNQNLYLVMEFHAGGDLLSLLSRHDDIFEESMARFYLAEMTLAIHALHSMRYVHRDIKPENILIDVQGHVKLADFGSAAKLSPDMLVSSRMPVGTPDYVSPELLTSMNNHRISSSYGVEVDWWSLGICMYEMLYGKTPFTDENGSMVITYSNIMNYQRCLSFPENDGISKSAINLIKCLLTDKSERLGYGDVVTHAFFSKINWDNLRQETPPFVPHLSSLDDTSNFEEFEKIRYKPSFDDYQTCKDFSGKDLPFVGFTYVRPVGKKVEREVPVISDNDTESSTDDLEVSSDDAATRNLEVKLTVKINELQGKYHKLEEEDCSMRSELENLQMSNNEKDSKIAKLQLEKEAMETELQTYITKTTFLSEKLDTAEAERDQLELRVDKMYREIQEMTKEAQVIEEEILRCQVQELQEVVGVLEGEKENLLRKVTHRDKQLDLYREQLGSTQKQMAKLQSRLDKERRKSRGDQKRDLHLLETREDMWRSQVQDKTNEVNEKDKRIQELEDLIEAYEQQEKDYMEREQELLKRVQDGRGNDKLDIRVLLKTGRSPCKKEYENKKQRIKELEELVEKYEADAVAWQEEEDQFRETIDSLRNEIDSYKHRSLLSSQTKENLMQQVKMYQDEVGKHRQKIKELQECIQMHLEEEDTAKKNKFAEKHIKELEIEVEMLRDDKRNMLKERLKQQEETEEQKLKLAEHQRTLNRLTSKLERTERQLSASRDREVNVRIKAREQQDLRNKLQDEKVASIEKENSELQSKIKELKLEIETAKIQGEKSESDKDEIKRLRNTIDNDNKNIRQLQEKLDKSMGEKFELSKKVQDLRESNEGLQESLKTCKEELERLDETLKEVIEMKEEITKLRDENDTLKGKISELESETKKLPEFENVRKEKDSLEVKLQNLEKELEEQKILSAKRWNKVEDAEDLRQENRYLESKVKGQQVQIEQLEIKIKGLQIDLTAVSKKDEKIRNLTDDADLLRLQKRAAEVKVQEMKTEFDQKQMQMSGNKREVQHLEEKLQKEKDRNDQVMSELRKELQDSNLSLSEARSLLSASQRQEQSMRDKYDAEIRDLQLKLHRAQGSADLEDDLKLVQSQNQKFNRQFKEMEDKITALQKEKSALSMEKQMMKDSLVQKEHQCELEEQKVEKLQNICSELEGQIKDMEALTKEHENRETEWNNIRKTYETAVDEREEEIEGTSQKLQALQQAKQSASEKLKKMKEELRVVKLQQKSEIDALNQKLWESNKATHKYTSQVSELEAKIAKLQMVAETQTKTVEAEVDEKTKLKEEISSTLTENQTLRSKNLKLKQSLDEAMNKFELIFGEKVDLENFAEALQGLHFLEKYKFESTIGQQMKLIDYLQVLYEENNGKKKKSGKKGGKSVSSLQIPGIADLQSSLELERKRNLRLTEQMDKLRQENYNQAQELLHLKGPLKEKMEGTLKPHEKAAVAALVRTPSTQHNSSHLLTPRVSRTQSFMQDFPPTPQRMHHNIPHRFVTGLNTRATKCGVCLGSVPFVKQASKCQECHMTCHPKCVASAQATCGLPTEYIQHFTTIMYNLNRQSKKYSQVDGLNPIKMQGWLKVPRTGKTGWERRWALLESNILLIYQDETDANPVDTFDLNPAETDVTIHSAVSMAELPNTATTDLPYVMKLEHEPLTTCWPGRVIYVMAVNFSEKQKWVACIEAAVKSLLKVDATFKRTKLQEYKLLELTGERRLEMNCSLVLSNQILLIGADEGMHAVNIHNGKHAVITKLTGIQSVHQIVYASGLSSVVCITDKDRKVVYIHKDSIKSRLSQATCDQTTEVPYTVIEQLQGCTVLDCKVCDDSIYLVGGLADRVVLMKYNTELRAFCIRKEFMTQEPCSCVCIAEDFAVFGSEKFYRFNLEHPVITEFVDKRDNSLAFAAFGAAIHNSYPLAVVNVSPEGLPLEFLLCFHEFGVFVDSKGRRSRPNDMKWSCLPLSFAYSEPFLYVTYFNSVQAITVPADKTETRGKQTCVDIHCPRYVGNAMTTGGIYISTNTGHSTDLICLRGADGLPYSQFDNKENKNRTYSSSSSKYSSSKSGSLPRSRMRRELSLTSINSNASVSSGCTISSESTTTSIDSYY